MNLDLEQDGEASDHDPACLIAVHVYATLPVLGDVELFHSPEDFKQRVTRSALRTIGGFDSIEMVIPRDHPKVTVTFAKGFTLGRSPLHPWLERGVLIEAYASSKTRRAAAVKIRNRVQAAARRNLKDSANGPSLGETWNGQQPQEVIAAVLTTRRKPTTEGRLVAAALTICGLFCVIAGVAALFGESLIHRVQASPGGKPVYQVEAWHFFGSIVVGAVLGWGVMARFIRFWVAGWPSVEVREHQTLTSRGMRYVAKVVGGLLLPVAIIYLSRKVFGVNLK